VARTEARIFTSIWRDEHFLALPPSAQRLYMFLLSQDDLAYTGVMPLRERRWASKAAGLTMGDIEQDLKALETAGRMFIVTDPDTGELLIRSMMRRDSAWKQPNLLKQARESADQIESQKIRAVLAAELRRLPLDDSPSAQVKTLVAEFIADLEKGWANPSAYPSANPSDESHPDPSGDPSAKDHACARELGGGYSPTEGTSDLLAPDSKTTTAQDRKRGTRIPDDFAVTPAMVAWFRDHCPHVDGRSETDAFIDYWHGKPGREGCKLDWPATWRNWMRSEEKKAGPRTRGRPSVPEATTDQRVAQAQALKQKFRQQGGPDQPQLPPGTIPGEVMK
jgi:hypothetical protein